MLVHSYTTFQRGVLWIVLANIIGYISKGVLFYPYLITESRVVDDIIY